MFPYFSTTALYIRVFFKHESSIVISDDISGFIQINLADYKIWQELVQYQDYFPDAQNDKSLKMPIHHFD